MNSMLPPVGTVGRLFETAYALYDPDAYALLQESAPSCGRQAYVGDLIVVLARFPSTTPGGVMLVLSRHGVHIMYGGAQLVEVE